ncbi:MAG: hypothetical protein O7D36_09960 [Gammaproteobacteria bacterium]|nr:hypothetical protein [Gammaproteobacteria bacterium]
MLTKTESIEKQSSSSCKAKEKTTQETLELHSFGVPVPDLGIPG